MKLDGEWTVERVGGALPPMTRVRKRIDGPSGVTIAGRLLEPDGAEWSGRATWFGREFGRFRMSRVAARSDHPEQPV